MPNIPYRDAYLPDVSALARIRTAEWGTEQYWQDRIGGYMRGEVHPQQSLLPRIVLVAAEEMMLVGVIAGHLTRRFDCDGELEWLDGISERRRRGIAGASLAALVTSGDSRQARGICVYVDRQNGSDRACYR